MWQFAGWRTEPAGIGECGAGVPGGRWATMVAMSDVSPGPDWWQASDGRWYPPELRPATALVRQRSGATILVRTEEESTSHAPVVERRSGIDEVGGAIAEHDELYLGRPAGQQNRPAAWFALAGSIVMLAGALLPWARRDLAVGSTLELGWRDAGGELGSGFFLVLIAVTVATVSVRCMAGSYSRVWRAGLVALALSSLGLLAVEAFRIERAIADVADLARGNVALSFGPGLLVAAVGSLIVLVAAAAYRVGSPH